MISQYTMDARNLVQIRQSCKSLLKVNQLRKVNTVVLDNTNALGEPPTLCTGPAVVDLTANHTKVVNNSYDRDFLLRRSDYVRSNIDMHKMDPDVCLRVKRLGLHWRGKRGGVRLQSHLDVIRPLGSHKDNLLNINRITDLSKHLKEKNIGLLVLNAQSIKCKDDYIFDHLIKNSVDLAIITETWLKDTDTDKVWWESTPLNNGSYRMSISNRSQKCGGRLSLVYKSHLPVTKLDDGELETFQYSKWKVEICHTCITVVAVYHPPDTSNLAFVGDFIEWIVDPLADNSNLLVAGDFNLHVNDKNDDDSNNFIDAMTALGLIQHVTFATHNSGNTLNLVMTEVVSDIRIEGCIPNIFFSDHSSVSCVTLIECKDIVQKEVTYRDLKHINFEEMSDEVMLDLSIDDFSDMVADFHKSLANALDKHAPEITKSITECPKVHWFSDDVKTAKHKMRRRERLWRKYKTHKLWLAFKDARCDYKSALYAAKTAVISDKVISCGKDSQKLYSLVNNLLGRGKQNCLPDCDSDADLANDFATFFFAESGKA